MILLNVEQFLGCSVGVARGEMGAKVHKIYFLPQIPLGELTVAIQASGVPSKAVRTIEIRV